MTENHDLAPDADVDEQRRSLVESGEGLEGAAGSGSEPAPASVPFDADPADAAEQAEPVPFDDDEYR
ncbi:hypothetical protein [Prauserella rugosa]|uniref:Uncharacterized protein n=1 Tax=Prauserella rugosa TaxID=43354 RepID=A0A660C9D9_9PSEU|nr:hypothetical protein [Prauserella rugosa]KID29712.1 hypothetical protein HQ32_03127 [Prauserella sp. Am3]KMS88166.1 hypothetical protein ACZ91_27295 [Streptomyces regensis]TWH18477.1 hypothetical protein JD82_00295 [Prauserella rugosa]